MTQDAATLAQQLHSTRRLPSPPGTAIRVLELCRRDDVDLKDITDVLKTDPVLSGRLLRYANSSLVAPARKITSIEQAVGLLGVRAVQLTALGFALAPDADPTCPGFDLQHFWRDSTLVAATARILADQAAMQRLAGKVPRDEAFTAGLLAALGQLALAYGIPDDYAQVAVPNREDRFALAEAERNTLGCDYAFFGAEVATLWELPELLCDAIRFQLAPDKAPSPATALASVVHAATILLPVLASEQPPEPARQRARALIENQLKLTQQQWNELGRQILEDHRELAEVFEIRLSTPHEVFDLYGQAQEQATRVGLVAQLERARVLEENRKLLKQAHTDPLTGVANRARLEQRLSELCLGVARGHGHFAVVMFDIDHFKQFNDTYGHALGDEVLRHVAQIVLTTIREVDLLARYGGEEFAVLAPQTDRRGACTLAARIRTAVADSPLDHDSGPLSVTISVGLALSSDYRNPPTPLQILRDADRQLYLSKERGRNTWSYLDRTAAQLLRQKAAIGASR